MRRLYTYQIVWMGIGMIILMLMTACADDHEQEEKGGDTLRMLTYTRGLQDVEATRSAVVTLPTGFVEYTTLHPEAATEHHAVGIYLTMAAEDGNKAKYSRFVYEGNQWHSYAIVMEGVTYYIYGFLPISGADHASITPYQDNYSKGADLTLHSVKSLSDVDICMLVGLQGVENVDDDVEVPLGSFYYKGKAQDKNNLYALFNHLYSAVQFSIRVSEQYASLRKVRLKSVKLKAATTETVDVTVAMRPGETPIANISIPSKGAQGCEVVLLDTESELTTSYVPLGDLWFFFNSMASGMKLESVYDVYDLEDNLVRENCVSETKLNFLSILNAGDKRNVKLTVSPTYLYQLSEEDLDSPTFRVED